LDTLLNFAIMNLPIVARIQPAVPSPPQHSTRKSGTCEKNFKPGCGPPSARLKTCLGFRIYRNLFSNLSEKRKEEKKTRL